MRDKNDAKNQQYENYIFGGKFKYRYHQVLCHVFIVDHSVRPPFQILREDTLIKLTVILISLYINSKYGVGYIQVSVYLNFCAENVIFILLIFGVIFTSHCDTYLCDFVTL